MRRIRTNTPLQALASLNDPVGMEAARRLALRTLGEAGSPDKRTAEHLFELAAGRTPRAEETQKLLALHSAAKADLGSRNAARQMLHYDQMLYTEDRELALVADARKNPSEWRYSLEAPGEGWTSAAFDDSGWKNGKGRFGVARPPGSTAALPSGYPVQAGAAPINTPWDSEQLWLRVAFDIPAGTPLENYRIVVNFSGGFEAFVNGVAAAASSVERSSYFEYPLEGPALASLKPGRNLLAIRAYRTFEGGRNQGFDAGLVALREPEYGQPRADDADRAAWVVVANAVLNLDELVTRR